MLEPTKEFLPGKKAPEDTSDEEFQGVVSAVNDSLEELLTDIEGAIGEVRRAAIMLGDSPLTGVVGVIQLQTAVSGAFARAAKRMKNSVPDKESKA